MNVDENHVNSGLTETPKEHLLKHYDWTTEYRDSVPYYT